MTQSDETAEGAYALGAQVGFLLRRANQRHLAIFARALPELTPTQFAALAQLCADAPLSQNALGRATAMDAATIKGVVDRLRKRALVTAAPDPDDSRRLLLSPTGEGRALYDRLVPVARAITTATLEPLSDRERQQFLTLLKKLV